ncbi:MAG: transglutaminase-like domain-containing protein [Lachnospiraceae bacterium]|nr:transglutaminase-like domain-containing protein [Lachnospiraceae bacterium]
MAKILQKKKNKPDILLSEGIILSGCFYEKREGTWANLLVRAIFLFAIVTGSLGGMLSAFQISYIKWAFFLTALFAALYCASLYASGWWENTGYILIFIVVAYSGLRLRTYISSGFYGILNDISSSASIFFESDAQVSYAEQVENHYLAITVAMCYFALISCIVTNGLISRKSKYLAASVPAVLFLMVPIYLEHEPEGIYVILLAVGIITVYIYRQNQYLSQRPKQKVLLKAAKKHLLLGNFSGGAALGALFAVALLCTVIVSVTELLIPKDSYLAGNARSSFKLQTMDTMENFYLLGVMGLINFYPTTGGLVNGRLGGVGSVRLDYETDLTLEFVPYTYDRIYLKSFIGAEYIPYENHWSIEDQTAYLESQKHDTADRLEDAFLSGRDGYARAVMKIMNVAAMSAAYLPYYSNNSAVLIPPTQEAEYTFFPLLGEVPDGSADPLVSDLWLEVPEENREVIADFCDKAGLSGSSQEIIDGLRDYFQQEYPYTLSPGATPRRKDFINYFLAEKRKGYCAHYASSAVLILRYMGIPARYVEGYAVDAAEIAQDAERTAQNVSDYYEGTSLLAQSSVVSYDVSDGNAHAWVEVYDENLGWYPVELTPYWTTQEESRNSLWDMFTRLFQTEGNAPSVEINAPNENTGAAITDTIRSSAPRLVFCLVLLIVAIPVWFLTKRLIRLYRYSHADRNGKLLMLYHSMIQKESRNELKNMKNFEEQIAWLAENGFLNQNWACLEDLIQTLNEAAFSQREISAEAFDEACRIINGR